jgi:hypothetical protein
MVVRNAFQVAIEKLTIDIPFIEYKCALNAK